MIKDDASSKKYYADKNRIIPVENVFDTFES
jgi:hypothetical protein